MAIESTYRELLISEYISEQLKEGRSVSAFEIKEQVDELIEEKDLSVPQFVASGYHTEPEESSSVAKYTETFRTIRQDLRVLYKDMLNLSKVSSDAFERWGLESTNIEKKLIDLEDRIEDLLLLTQDTEGYHSVLIDNFTDSSLIDTDLTTAELNLGSALVHMGTTSSSGIRFFLNDLDPVTGVSFKIRSTANFINRTDATGASLTDPFHQESKSWWTSIAMEKARPVTCELTVKLGDEPVDISRIFMELHESAESSPTTITPLYSVDNQTFNQLPTTMFSQEVRTNITFQFSEVQAKWIKFILTKSGPDPSAGTDYFCYEFGFKQIAFYHDAFDTSVVQKLITKPLWITAEDGSTQTFEKLTLDTCERLETDTSIKYYVTTTNDLESIDTGFDYDSALWVPISPVSRKMPLYPVILDVGDTTEVLLGDTETVKIAYDTTASETTLINPSDPFRLLSKNPITGAVLDEEVHAKDYDTIPVVRYAFKNTNDRILNYQIKQSDYVGSGSGDALIINEAMLTIFRNVGEVGLTPGSTSALVRGVQRGWRFEDPYYVCVVEIRNPEGIVIDVGDSPIIIDDISYTNKIDGTVLTGKTTADSGLHTIKVHKSNWKEVSPGATDLADLQAKDILYPYNHKLLIEGYDYNSSFADTQVYTGVDLFTETVMKQVSIFDVMNNVAVDNYNVFALDVDTPNSHEDGNLPTRVFVLKVDENNPDFQNERFMIRFTLVNQLQKYLRLRVDFSTIDGKVTPALHSYKMKLG